MEMRSPAWLILLLVGLAVSASGQSISLSQSIDRTDMAFEDTAVFEISITWDGPPTAYRFDRAIRLVSEKLKVARFNSNVSSAGAGDSEVTTKRLVYELVPKLDGPATIEPVAVEYVSWPDSVAGALMTDPVQITVARPLPKEELERRGLSSLWYVAFGLLAVTIAGLAVYSGLRRKQTAVQPAKSPSERAIEGLETSRKQAGNDLKIFQTGVYKVLTDYLATRYGMAIENRPVADIVEALQERERDESVRGKLVTWLTRAEKEKFVPVSAPPGEVIRLETEMRKFFESMK